MYKTVRKKSRHHETFYHALWKPSRDRDDLPKSKPQKNDQGILFLLVETQNDPRLGQELGRGDVGRYLVLLDCRK